MDRFAALRVFVAVAETGGFAPAARRLGVATSSVMRQVNALEADLGVPLFDRSTRRIVLTNAGRAYRERVVRIFAELDEADRFATEEDSSPHGLLRVSLPAAFGRMHVSPAVVELLRRYPGIQLEVRLTDSLFDLAEEGIDVAIRICNHQDGDVIAHPLAPHLRVVCASPDYLERWGVPEDPDALADHNCLVLANQGDRRLWHFVGPEGGREVQVQGSLVADNSEILRDAALGGVGIVLLPTWLVGGDVKAGRLTALLKDWEIVPPAGDTEIYAVYLPTRRSSHKVQLLIRYLEGYFESPACWDSPL